jgi:2-dehydropantoate 2-reductase
MLEVLSVSRRYVSPEGAIALPDSVAMTIIENENPKSVFKPSMLVDLEASRPIEVEAIVGGIVSKAQSQGLPIPRLEMIYAGLKVIQKSLVR